MVSLETVVVRTSAVLDASVEDETVLMSIETGQYFVLKATSRAIWDRLDRPVRAHDLCSDLAELYQAPLERVRTDTLAFLDHLAAHKMIELQSG